MSNCTLEEDAKGLCGFSEALAPVMRASRVKKSKTIRFQGLHSPTKAKHSSSEL